MYSAEFPLQRSFAREFAEDWVNARRLRSIEEDSTLAATADPDHRGAEPVWRKWAQMVSMSVNIESPMNCRLATERSAAPR